MERCTCNIPLAGSIFQLVPAWEWAGQAQLGGGRDIKWSGTTQSHSPLTYTQLSFLEGGGGGGGWEYSKNMSIGKHLLRILDGNTTHDPHLFADIACSSRSAAVLPCAMGEKQRPRSR